MRISSNVNVTLEMRYFHCNHYFEDILEAYYFILINDGNYFPK